MIRNIFFTSPPEKYLAYRHELYATYEWYDIAIERPPATLPPLSERGRAFGLYQEQLYTTIARYSAGHDIDIIKQEFEKTLDRLSDYRQSSLYHPLNFEVFDEYMIAIWTAALASLLGIDPQRGGELINQIAASNKDALYDKLCILFSSKAGSATNLCYPDPYAYLYEATQIIDKTAASKQIELFLLKYYAGMHPASWYDSHKPVDNSAYFGYWVFEMAAIVRVFDLPDQAFEDNIFYPRDLIAGKKLLRSWTPKEGNNEAPLGNQPPTPAVPTKKYVVYHTYLHNLPDTCPVCQKPMFGTGKMTSNDADKRWIIQYYCNICMDYRSIHNPHYLPLMGELEPFKMEEL